jgi:hypothetical protein
MTDDIDLNDLIDQLKSDLFAPYAHTSQTGKQVYPIFFVDGVEVELAVNISYEAGVGLKISVPQVAELAGSGGAERGRSHTMKIKLSPILTREELRAGLDEQTLKGIQTASQMALRRGSTLAGDEE